MLSADALVSRPAVIVSGDRPAAERAWLMSASTCAAAVPGEAPGEPVADAVGDGVAGVADADGVGVGRTASRLAGGDDRFAEAAGGTLAKTAWKGCPAHDPAAAASQVAGVCRAVTLPDAGGGSGSKPWAR